MTLPLAIHAQSLLDALRAANATAFADYVGGNAAFFKQLNDSSIKTIFAPNDDAMKIFLSNGTLSRRQLSKDALAGRQTSKSQETTSQMGSPPGETVHNDLPGAGGKNEVVVAQPPPSAFPRNTTARFRARQATSPSPINLYSGLGKSVTIVKGDTPYAHGLIQTTDGFFTPPESFTSSFSKTGLTSLVAGLQNSSMGSALEAPAGVTIFSLGNNAYQAATGNITNSAQLGKLLSGYIVPNTLAYLPDLKDGDTLKTLAGTTLTVRIRNGFWYINGVRIISPNQITTTGVSHVLESPFTPVPALTPFKGSAWFMSPNRSMLVACVISLLLTFLV